MKAPRVSRPTDSVAVRFRRQIEAAEAEGANRPEMRLKLTLGDSAKLKRDPSLPVTDISFTEGVMHFLGVAVEQGGVSESTLNLSGPE